MSLAERFVQIREEIAEYKPHNPEQILGLVKQYFSLNKPNKDYRVFNHGDWYGIITLKRNEYMGSIFSRYKGKPLVIRGYPKLKYTDDVAILEQPIVAERKYDGTNLGCFLLGDIPMVKTRLVERGDIEGYKGRVWIELLAKLPVFNILYRAIKDENLVIFGELYGRENPGEFIKYSVPLAFKVFDVYSLDDYEWWTRREKERLCLAYDLPIVEVDYEGSLDWNKIRELEQSLSSMVKDDGSEGLVVKTLFRPQIMAKLKPPDIKEKCYEKSSPLIPTSIIKKAIQKARENLYSTSSKEEFLDLIRGELLEEASETLVNKSWKKVLRLLYESTDETLEGKVQRELDEYEGNIYNKGAVMSHLADKFPDVKPSTLYHLYQAYLKSLEGGN